jgi:sec-independent protein translocase protein TatA
MGISFGHLLLVLLILLIFFGPTRLPELGKSLGKGIHDFKKALNEGETGNAQLESREKELLTTSAQDEKKV